MLVFEMATASIAAIFISRSSECSRDGLMNGSRSGQFLSFFAKRSKSAFSVIHLGGILIPGAFWNIHSKAGLGFDRKNPIFYITP